MQVGPVDRGGGDLDEHLTGTGHGVGHLGPGQDLGPTRGGDDDGVHRPSVARGHGAAVTGRPRP